MAKLNREALMHYLDTGFHSSVSNVSQAAWEILGDDIEEMSMELNSEVDQTKNILGQNKTTDNGYTPSMDADPFYADPEKGLYEPLRDIAMERKTGSACKTLLLEVIVENTSDPSHLAYVREVMVKPQSYGGGTEGFNIPFTVSEDGASVKGTVTIADGVPTFTKAS